MASFFQPAKVNPEDLDAHSRFLVFRNAALPRNELFQHWYQYLLVSVGCASLITASTILLVSYLKKERPADKPNVFVLAFLYFLKFTRRLGRVLHVYEVEEEDDEHITEKTSHYLGGISGFKVIAPNGAGIGPGLDSNICILPVTASPQKYWDGTRAPRLRGNFTPGGSRSGSMTPTKSGWQSPFRGKTGSWTPFTRAGNKTPTKTHSSASSISDAESIAPMRSGSHRSDQFIPINFMSNEVHESMPISAATSMYEGVTSHSRPSASALFFGYQGFTNDQHDPENPMDPDNLSASLSDTCLNQGFDGLVLQFDDTHKASIINKLLENLQKDGIPVIFMAETDAFLLDSLHFGLIDGIILQNAHILRNGLRRDYFRSGRLREQTARVKRQQAKKPEFFFGFLELWTQQPSASTLRRAYKLADFYGANIEARPASSTLQDRQVKEMPLSGFDYLKKADVIWIQKQWSRLTEVNCDGENAADTVSFDVTKITDILPQADRLLATKPVPLDLFSGKDRQIYETAALDYAVTAPRISDFWNTASCGASLCPVGSFELREEVVQEQYDEIVKIQKHLKRLDMLHQMALVELTATIDALTRIEKYTSHPVLLYDLRDGLRMGRVRVYKGLDSGFTLPDNGGHFWGISDEYEERGESVLEIYLSQKNADDAATIWHVFLAHNDIPRSIRYMEEVHFTKGQTNEYGVEIPKSIRRELEESTEAELLYMLQQIKLSNLRHDLGEAIKTISTKLLLEKASTDDWYELNSKTCLDGSITLRELFQIRLDLLQEKGATALPDVNNLLVLYSQLEQKMGQCLFDCDRSTLNRLMNILLQTYSAAANGKRVDITTDIFALIYFCVLRKFAFEDVYTETTDRCPLFLSQHDQAGVFAELWMLGSQCEIYFGMLPRMLGEIIYDRYRAYLDENPPPRDAWNGKDVFTAYSNVAPKHKVEGFDPLMKLPRTKVLPGAVPGHKLNEPVKGKRTGTAWERFGAISIFCFPAIIDVCLLTFVGRGFYLTAFMDREVREMANYAILTALIMTCGTTGWVGSTGGFYLYNYAFDNLTHFLVQRFSAAVMLNIAVGICGFVAFGIQHGWFNGFVFVLYLTALTTFLNLLGIMATMHREGSPLTSGRIAMWKCIPILFISPILSTFVNGHDLLIYMLVIHTFLITLILYFRSMCREWTSWQAKIPTIKEKDLLAWFKEKLDEDEEEEESEQDNKLLATEARELLKSEVKRYQDRSLYVKIMYTVTDEFVKKMAIGHPFAMWLLEKEAGEAELPEMYTATWFVQLELALGNQRQLVRGLKEHSPFITFRYSKYDLGQNVGLFLGALMDRWVALATSARQPQADLYYSFRSKYALCFGLLYFLCGAVSVDVVLQRYWPKMSEMSKECLVDLKDYYRNKAEEAATRRQHYRSALFELLTLLFLVLGLVTVLLWGFVDDSKAIILFFTYISGYTGVLLFQFHRCFTKNIRAHVITVFSCCALGFVVGVILRALPATAGWFYDDAVALNTATITAAIATFVLTGYFYKTPTSQDNDDSSNVRRETQLVALKSVQHAHDMIASFKSCKITHRSMRDILQNLTLDVNVNVRWAALPEDVRRVIVYRVLGLPTQHNWTVRTWLIDNGKNLQRFNDGITVAMQELRIALASKKKSVYIVKQIETIPGLSEEGPELSVALPRVNLGPSWYSKTGKSIVSGVRDTTKWIAIISGAAPDTPKELWYSLRKTPFRLFILWSLLKVWKLCDVFKNALIHAFLISRRKPYTRFLDLLHKGAPRSLEPHRVVVETATNIRSGFISSSSAGNLIISVYDGDQLVQPTKDPLATAFYGASYRLVRREQANGAVSTYQYEQSAKENNRWPTSRLVIENGVEQRSTYDQFGRIKSGRILRGGKEFAFEYVFATRPKDNPEVLQATYSSKTEKGPMTMAVFFATQPRGGSSDIKNWTPSEKVQRVIFTTGGQTFDVRWIYNHAQNPEHETTVLSKDKTESYLGAPEQITKDEHGFLKKPKNVSFDEEDLLIHHPTKSVRKLCRISHTTSEKADLPLVNKPITKKKRSWFSSDKKVVYRKLSSSQLRTMLWRAWGKAPFIDAVTACLLDEKILRKERLLKHYWSLRDAGHLRRAANALDENLERIIASIEPQIEVSQTCPMLIKSSDLFEMGLAKDCSRLTARPEDTYRDTPNSTSVIFSDNGCWPDNPGGVSNCRRDLVNGHTTIRGHCLAEGANDYGIPRYQIERNVNSLKVLPLWGLDGKTPNHCLLDNLLQGQIDDRLSDTDVDHDVVKIFIPLLKSFVRGARSRRYKREDLVTYSNVILKMNRYFETRDFNKTWNSDVVWQAWIEAWLCDYKDSNVINFRDMLEIEHPTLTDLRGALDLYICYFFIYSVEIPEDCPKVFQTTHHGISSLYGILLKYRRGTTWGIWDHAILWRETCLNISPAQCLLNIPVQSMLLAGVKLACHLAYTHADIILPCTSVFNPDWEMDLGTDQGLRGSKKLFARKIDPIVNGIGNMDAFQPIKETRTKIPTCVMLSNVQFIKDVKNAVLAADVIINKFGFQDYRLMVYGAQDRQPSYALETTTLINARGMADKVILAGFGSPKEVLKDAWLFMNSSLSEGLPLAIGEAALSGIPIVATEVGATALVLTDPDDSSKRYGEVVPPNDPEALARAQISILAMLGPWTAYTKDETPPPPLPDVFTPEDVVWITKRMYEKQEDRKALGLKLRDVVLRSFHGKRYLREHEQMYWIQRKQAEVRRAGKLSKIHPPVNATFGEQNLYSYDVEAENEQLVRPRWQEFDVRKLNQKRTIIVDDQEKLDYDGIPDSLEDRGFF